jgi:uncharacterized lipoprotein YehR (DUF1307 family)
MKKLFPISLTAILALIIALAIAGCGGSRSGSSNSGNLHTIYVSGFEFNGTKEVAKATFSG